LELREVDIRPREVNRLSKINPLIVFYKEST